MSISNYLEEKLLGHVLTNTSYTSPTTVYLALHNGNPGETGANELTNSGGSAYGRQAVSFNAPVNPGGTCDSSATVTFTNMPDTTAGGISYMSLWDASTTGNCLWIGPTTTTKVTNLGDKYEVPAGSLTVTLD